MNPSGIGGQRTSWTIQKKGKFLAELLRSANVSAAARLVGFSRSRIYVIRDEDPGFATDWDHARKTYAENVLEVEADRRAVEGVHHKTYYDKEGNVVGEERRYSDTLLIFRLKAIKKEEYAERSESNVNVKAEVTTMTPDDRRARIAILEAKLQPNILDATANGTHRS